MKNLAYTTASMFYAPRDAIAFAHARPRAWWWPATLVVASAAAFWAWYFYRVDAAWLTDQALAQLGRGLPAGVAESVQHLLTPQLILAQTVLGTVVSVAVTLAAIAGYLHIAARLAGDRKTDFLQWLSLASWSRLVDVVVVAGWAVAYGVSPERNVDPDDLAITSLGPVLGLHESGVVGVLLHFNLVSIWAAVVLALGFRANVGGSTARAAAVVALPWAVLIAVRLLIVA